MSAPSPTRDKAGFYELEGWYTETSLSNKWSEGDIVTSNLTLYAKWTPLKAIGDEGPGGGIIYHVSTDGFLVEGYTGGAGSFPGYTAYYLEAAPSNSGNRQWGAFGTAISGLTSPSDYAALSTRIGNGRKDTLTIVDHLAFTNETNRAAQVAAALSFGGYSDWFLPSLGELILLHNQRNHEKISISNNIMIWSSSPFPAADNRTAYAQDFLSAGPAGYNRNEQNITVRAVRAF